MGKNVTLCRLLHSSVAIEFNKVSAKSKPLPHSGQIQQTAYLTLFLIFPRKQDLTFHVNVSLGDNLHEMSKPVSGNNKKNIFKCRLLKILPSMLSVNSVLEKYRSFLSRRIIFLTLCMLGKNFSR